jgi:hypothetical protein
MSHKHHKIKHYHWVNGVLRMEEELIEQIELAILRARELVGFIKIYNEFGEIVFQIDRASDEDSGTCYI